MRVRQGAVAAEPAVGSFLISTQIRLPCRASDADEPVGLLPVWSRGALAEVEREDSNKVCIIYGRIAMFEVWRLMNLCRHCMVGRAVIIVRCQRVGDEE